MTHLQQFLQITSFTKALRLALSLTVEDQDAIKTALGGPIDRPAAVPPTDWSNVRAVVRNIYEVSSREGKAAVLEDLKVFLGTEASSDLSDVVSRWAAQDDLIDRRLEGSRARDSVQPNLIGFNTTIDLRVLPDSDDGQIEAAPVLTLRAEFDETLGNSDALVFQLPFGVLDALIEQLQARRAQIDSFASDTLTVAIPSWARLESQEAEE